MVAQLAARRPVLAKELSAFKPASNASPLCAAPEWQRDPMQITFHPQGKDAITFDLVPGSAMLVEESDEEAETTQAKPN